MAKKKKKKKKLKVKKKRKKAVRKKKVKKAKKAKKTKKAKKAKKTKPAPESSSHVQELVLAWRVALPGESFIGVVEDYFSHVGVFATALKAPVQQGDKIHVRGHTTDLIFTADSMQIEHQPVQTANTGDSIGIKASQRVRKGDYIYKILL